MALLRIYETPEPILREISTPVEKVDDEVRALIKDMFETMYEAPGIGLAAVQVGIPKRLLVMDLQEPENEDDPESKPSRSRGCSSTRKSSKLSDHEVPYTEGCLSVPDQYAEVMRPDRIRARWLDENGDKHEEWLEGLLAVCLQHEMDHLEGVLFIDHLSKLKRDMVLKKLAKARKERGLRAA